jgi:hypothetical protein
MNKQTFCESCGMTLVRAEDFGTEHDDSKSTECCHYRYQNGQWTDANITFDEMLQFGKTGIKNNGEMGRFMKLFCLMTYRSMLKKCKRWRGN